MYNTRIRKFTPHFILLCLVISQFRTCRAFWFDRDVHYQRNITHDQPVESLKISSCGEAEFACDSLNCIENWKLCDSVRDCENGSDESIHICGEKDSKGILINVTSLSKSGVKKVRRDTTSNLCEVPSNAVMSVVVTDASSKKVIKLRPGSNAPILSRIETTCKDGYALRNVGKKQLAYCHDEGWFPVLSPCLKTCPRLRPEHVDLSCYYDDRKVNCNATELVSGTIVETRCKPFYYAKNVDYRTLRCLQDGKWDNDLYKCVPQCGSLDELIPFIFKGSATSVEKAPWNVAIYRTSLDHTLICGGTIISPRMVVSAAHCFFNRQKGEPLSAEDHEVIVSKYTRDYKKNDRSQKKHKIRKITVHENYDPKNHNGFDIAVLILEEAIEMSAYALPACVDWTALPGFNPGEGIPGKLAGWGIIDEKNDGRPSEILLAADLPFISFSKCKHKLSPLPNDQFCAGSDTGAGARQGDSGAGLVFQDGKKDNRYFLRGVVSLGKQSAFNASSVASFTDISQHLRWLDAERRAVEREPAKASTPSHQSTTIAPKPEKVSSKDATGCYLRPDSHSSVALTDEDGYEITPDTVPSVVKAVITCKPGYTTPKGSKIQRSTCIPGTVWDPPLARCIMSTSEKPTTETHCGRSIIGDRKITISGKADLGAWPWIAAIYTRRGTSKKPSFSCGGTLIANEWVLIPAHCISTRLEESNATIHVRLGDLDIDDSKDDKATPVNIEVKQVIKHPQYSSQPPSNDIALLRLSRPVNYTDYIRPICLHTAKKYLNDTYYDKKRAYLAGWGPLEYLGDRLTHLSETEMDVIPNSSCTSSYDRFKNQVKIDKTIMCTTSKCQAISGNPIMFKENQTWFQGGILTAGYECGREEYPDLSTKVASFADWIRKETGLNNL